MNLNKIKRQNRCLSEFTRSHSGVTTAAVDVDAMVFQVRRRIDAAESRVLVGFADERGRGNAESEAAHA